MNRILKGISIIRTSPGTGYRLINGLLRGAFYICRYRLFSRNIIIKFPFFVYCRFKIKGPGSVFIDKNCSAYPNTLENVNILTLSHKSKVVIGKGCTLGGLTIRCLKNIKIGDNALTAANLIQDFTFYSDPENLKKEFDLALKQISIGNDVWLGGQSCVFAGSVIGNNSVLGAHAVCYDFDIPENCLANGNPIKRPMPISNVLSFSEKLH